MATEDIDQIGAKLTRLLGTASATLLEEAFNEISLAIPPSAAGKASTLLRTLNRYLNSPTVLDESGDEGLSVYRQVVAVLEKEAPDTKEETTGEGDEGGSGGKVKLSKTLVKTEEVTNVGSASSSSTNKGGLPGGGTTSHVSSSNVNSVSVSGGGGSGGVGVDIMTKLKDFKLSGTVGGDKPMPYSSMVYQIQNGQRMGYPDHVICAAVLKATAAGSVRTYLELKKDLTVSSLLEILKTNFSVKDSGALFTELCNCTQDEDQKVGDFVFQLMVLREMIMDLGVEEGNPYDKTFLQKRLLRTLYVGIRSDSVRMELKDVFTDTNAPDEKILSAVNKTVAQETERLEKLQAADAATAAALAAKKGGGVSCNAVDSQGNGAPPKSAEVKSLENKKQRENNFQNQLKELQSKSDKQEKELQALRADQNKQHAELMAVLLNQNGNRSTPQDPNTQATPAGGGGQGGGGTQTGGQQQNRNNKSSRVFKCVNCWNNNTYRCTHCLKCGGPDHRAAECPNPPDPLNRH